MSDLASLPKRCLPVWVREGRRPTREELAAKHFADRGGMAPQADPQVDAFFADDGKEPPGGEWLELSDGTRVATPAVAPINVKRYNV